MPIKGLSEQRRLIRIGKIHLGIKLKNAKGVEYPHATNYFVCPPEIIEVYGEQPNALDIIIPVEDDEMWASQYYRQYSRTRGLVCRGDGVTARRMLDTDTGDVAGRNTKEVVWKEGWTCDGKNCPDFKRKACQPTMNLQFMLPKVPGIGIWQVDTRSINSIMNINNCATMIRAVCGKINWIPLVLTLEPTEVVNPDDGKKKTVHCLNLRHRASLQELVAASDKPRTELLIAAPVDNEEPADADPEEIPPEEPPPKDTTKIDTTKMRKVEPISPIQGHIDPEEELFGPPIEDERATGIDEDLKQPATQTDLLDLKRAQSVAGKSKEDMIKLCREKNIPLSAAQLTKGHIKQLLQLLQPIKPDAKADPRKVNSKDIFSTQALQDAAKLYFNLDEATVWKELGYTNRANFEEAKTEKPYDAWLRMAKERLS